MNNTYESEIDKGGNTIVPLEVMKFLDLKAGDRVIWKIDIENKVAYLSKNSN